ncbi:MAG: hypothetical protein QG649_662 [Patescibacteria group bacterium]|nr:hypothetical protein [Patescibacteria group bacterium]
MKVHILYIPGLGDNYDWFRTFSLRGWRMYGVVPVFVPITWSDKGTFESKLALVRAAVQATPKSAQVVLIGESAGATLALHVANSSSRVKRVITLCGVASRHAPISATLRQSVPALHKAVSSLPTSLTEVDTHSIRAWYDPVVNNRHSVASGAQVHTVPLIGHLFTIGVCLTLLAPYLVAIAKSNKK